MNRDEMCSYREMAWVKTQRIKEYSSFVMSGKENGIMLGREVGWGQITHYVL